MEIPKFIYLFCQGLALSPNVVISFLISLPYFLSSLKLPSVNCWIFLAEPCIFLPLLSCLLFLCSFLPLWECLKLYSKSSIDFFLFLLSCFEFLKALILGMSLFFFHCSIFIIFIETDREREISPFPPWVLLAPLIVKLTWDRLTGGKKVNSWEQRSHRPLVDL